MIVGDMEIRLRADIARLQRDMDDARRVVGNATTAMGRAADMAKTALAGIGIGAGVSEIAKASDEYSKLTAQLRLATGGAREYAQAYADVKRVANSAQADLSATGSLYAQLSRSTKDLGLSQQAVSDNTEAVALALKISGAGAQESSGAILQLSQAFAAGALRGDEFNSVNEAAPRLMQAIADSMGQPVGALRSMAAEGKLTADVVAKALPSALNQLRSEADQIQTISGAFTVLKNNVMEFTGTQAQASGFVSALTGGIGVLANNLTLAAGAAATVAAVKLGTWLDSTVSRTAAAVTANRTLAATTLATAEVNATATAQASLLANARLAEVRAATLAAAGETQLALTTNALIPAQARAAAAAEAHSLAMGQLTIAQRAASLSATAASGVIGALGGPIGALITVLGLAATAWVWYKQKQDEANASAKGDVEQSTAEMIDGLQKQNEKLRERIELSKKAGMADAANLGGPNVERAAEILKKINELKAQGAKIAPGDAVALIDYEGQYDALKREIDANAELKRTLEANGKAASDLIAVRQRLTGVNQQYLDDLAKFQTALEKGSMTQAEYTDAVSKLATETFKNSTAGKDNAQAIDTSIAALRRRDQVADVLTQRELARIAAVRDAGGMNEVDAINASAKADLAAFDRKSALIGKEIALLKGKADTEKEQADLQGQREEIAAQRRNRELQQQYQLAALVRKAKEEALRFDQAYSAGLEATSKILEKMVDDARVEADQNEEVARTYGLSKTQIEKLTLARLEDQLAQKASLGLTLDEIDTLEKVISAKKRTVAALSNMEEVEAQRKAWESIERTAHDTFVSIADGGKAFWTRLRETGKNIFFDWLYQMTVKKWIFNIGASVGVTGYGSAAQAANLAGGSGAATGSTSDLINATQMASSLYKAVSGGFETLSTSVADAVQAGMYQSGISTQIASNGSFATGAGSATSVAAGMIGGHYLGNAISNGYGIGDHEQAVNNTGVAAGAGIGYYVGGMAGAAIGALIGGAAGGVLNRLFGMGDKEVTSRGMRGTLTAESLTGQNYANWHQDGGLFRSDKDGTDTTAFSEAIVKQFTQGLQTMEMVSSGFAKSLGVSADSISSYSKVFDIALTGDATKDAQAVTDFFTGVSDEIAKKLVPSLAEFTKSGETASAALERLAGEFQGTDQVAQLLGRSASVLFGATGIASAKARENLIGLAGGLSTLSSEASFFNQNFLTDAERIRPVAEALDKALGSLGLDTIPTTRDEFKGLINSLIDSGAAATDAGGKQLTSLLAIAEAFAQVHPQIDATAAAVEKAADALQAMKDSASMLLGDVDGAFSVLQRVVDREKKAVQASVNAHTAAVSKLQSLSQSLRGALDSIKSPDQQVMARAAAQSQIRAVLASVKAGGQMPDADSLKDALSAVSKDSTDRFATYQDYLKDLYQTQNDIAALGDVTDDQLSVEQKALKTAQDQLDSLDEQLAKAQEQIDILKGINTNGLTLIDAMAALTSAVLAANANPIVGATSAINGAYQSALHRAPDAAGLEWWQNAAANGAPVSEIVDGIKGSTEATLNTLYRDVLGRAPDAEGLAFWMQAYGSTMDAAEKADWMNAAQKDPGYKIPGFAAGGNFAGGWRIVGENGPELEATGPSRIFNASQTSDLFARLANPSNNTDALASRLDKLCAIVEGFQQANSAENMSIAKSVAKSADALDGASNGDKPLATKVIPA